MRKKKGNLQDRIKRVQERSRQASQRSNEHVEKMDQSDQLHLTDADYQPSVENDLPSDQTAGETRDDKFAGRQIETHEKTLEQEGTESAKKQDPLLQDSISEEVKPKRSNKLLKTFGAFALSMSILALVFSGTSTVDTSASAQNALSEQVSSEVSAGVILLNDDEELGAQDHTIVHNSHAEETSIWIWDYAAEDGDYVQVIVNGTPVTDSFMIKHKPREITVPAVGTIEIKGIRDGGGGITYAVRYDINGTSYFNTAPIGGQNTYELMRE